MCYTTAHMPETVQAYKSRITPRQVRRAFGPEAVEAFNRHELSIHEVGLRISDLKRGADNALEQIQQMGPFSRTFAGRMRWLFLGR